MTVNLSDLVTAKTRAELLAAILGELQAADFPTTDWTDGSPERTVIEAEIAAQLDLWALVPKIASGALVDRATGAWLTLLAGQRYSLERTEPTATVGTARLSCDSSHGPYTITAGQLQLRGAGGNLYRNTTGGTLNTSGTLNVTIQAESPGADEGNDGAATIVTLTTPIAGVSCTNPASTFSAVTCSGTSTGTVTPTFGTATSASWVVLITSSGQTGAAQFKLSSDGGLTYGTVHTTGGALTNVDSSGLNLAFVNGSGNPSFHAGESFTFTSKGAWYTTQGTDEESDASLRQRCKARWPGLSTTPTDDVYVAMCKAASPSVTRARATVDNVTPAQVNIVVAGSAGPIGDPDTITAIRSYVDARHPLTDVPVVNDAGTFAVTLGGGTVRVRAENLATAQQAAQDNVAAYIAGVAIGDGSTVKVRFSKLIEAILRDSGDDDDSVSGLMLNTGTVDVAVTDAAIATWSQTIATALTWATY